MPSTNNKKKKKNKPSKANQLTTQPDDDTFHQPLDDDSKEHSSVQQPTPSPATPPTPTHAFSHTQSAYERMTVQPIPATLPSHLVLPTDALSQKVNALSSSASPFNIYTSTTDGAGRRAIARRALHPGQLLICESALPAVIHSEWKGRVCAKCFTTVAEGGGGSRVCRACESVVYCSTACLMADVDVHRLECKVLRDLPRISDDSLVNVDLVRAALAYIVGRRPQRATEDDEGDDVTATAVPHRAAAKQRTDRFTPEWADVEGMVDNLSAVSAVDMQHMTAAASLLLSLLPASLHLPIPAIVSFMSRVNNNSHALSASSSASQHVGFGLFPLCSILNHSCYPNTIYTSHLSSLSMRVIREVAAGEELTVNYVGLYGGRWERRRELRDSKKFDCRCRRCVLQPASDEERDRFSFDQYVGALKCTSEKGGGSGKAGKKCGGFYRLVSDASAVLASEDDEVYMCNECGHQPATSELRRLELAQHDRVETALSLYSQQALSASALLSHFSSLTAELMAEFHPHHYLLFNLSLPLINLLHTLKEYRSWRDKIRSVRQLSSHVYPTYYLPSVNYMEAEVQSIDALVRVGAGKLPKKLAGKYREEQVALQTAIVEAVRVCVGGDSEMAKREERRLEEYQSLMARGG